MMRDKLFAVAQHIRNNHSSVLLTSFAELLESAAEDGNEESVVAIYEVLR